MNYTQKEEKIVLTEFDSFDIEETLESGSSFRFNRIAEKEYVVVAFSKILYVKQYDKNRIEFSPCTIDEFENIWMRYFDLKRNYSEIKRVLSENDPVLKEAIEFAEGIRIVNQDPYECLISFIISQNNRIPMIKKVIGNISRAYGENLEGDYYAFPEAETLNKASIEDIAACKTGFRAKYIKDALEKLTSGEIVIKDFEDMTTDEVREKLLTIYGVGQKVADCVMLFSMERSEVFPIDVWVKRVMQHFYFDNEEVNIRKIQDLSKEKWGEYAGFAQQYLFHYARMKQIGKK